MRGKFYLLVDVPNSGLKALMNWALRIKLKAGQDCSCNFIWDWTEFSLFRNEVPQKESHTRLTSKCRDKMRKMPWKSGLVIFLSGIGRLEADDAPMEQEPLLAGGWQCPPLAPWAVVRAGGEASPADCPQKSTVPSTPSYFCGLQPALTLMVTFCSEHSVLQHSHYKKCISV